MARWTMSLSESVETKPTGSQPATTWSGVWRSGFERAVIAIRSEPGPIAGRPRWRRKLAPASRSASEAGVPLAASTPSKDSPAEWATMNQGGTPAAVSAPIIAPAEVPTTKSALPGSQSVSSAIASSAPVSQAPPRTPPAPRTRPTFMNPPPRGGGSPQSGAARALHGVFQPIRWLGGLRAAPLQARRGRPPPPAARAGRARGSRGRRRWRGRARRGPPRGGRASREQEAPGVEALVCEAERVPERDGLARRARVIEVVSEPANAKADGPGVPARAAEGAHHTGAGALEPARAPPGARGRRN